MDSMIGDGLELLFDSDFFSDIDIHFSRFIKKISEGNVHAALGAALVSRATGDGHICIDLNFWAGKNLTGTDDEKKVFVQCPSMKVWVERLKESPVVGIPGEDTPLILNQAGKLYLNRYFEYEKGLTDIIFERIKDKMELNSHHTSESIAEKIHRFFPKGEEDGVDWQKVAAFVAATRKFCVISGGPGTGKTYVIANLIAVLISESISTPLRIFLCAPTGKAAARLKEAIGSAKKKLNLEKVVKDLIPDEVFTIHRLLQPSFDRNYFRYNEKQKLPADVIIVDEASMVDLALMYKLMSALHTSCRVVLVGDKDQLSSVEAGAVLGDICGRKQRISYSDPFLKEMSDLLHEPISGGVLNKKKSSEPFVTPLNDHIIMFQKSYRFDAKSGIGAVSRLVNKGDATGAIEVLRDSANPSVRFETLDREGLFEQLLTDKIKKKYIETTKQGNPLGSLGALNQFQVLCAVRKGPYGVQRINEITEVLLKREGLLAASAFASQKWYHGRPVMITRNDYQNGLFNGDLGITLKDDKNALSVYFPGEESTFRKFIPYRLGACETVFAMTIHKSQGSEFDHILIVLPDKENPVLTRELIYTGITRAKKSVTIWASREILEKTIEKKIYRDSGLLNALWGE